MLIDKNKSAMILIDVQEKLTPLVLDCMIWFHPVRGY